ncbi:putative phenylalanine--tRNA ligase alpha subunit [Hibiscus syriacus]|uniref:Phenylalanine--tRNA ligase alpha subunit n=1 Tax=Hibiscus syriacus TaxID=106335 RepID=A0A6A2Z3A4_HIBSY|nr:putative phenylalanine--tRNA ligase alpha subunit [Hibiscus syriacus]
MAEDAILSYLSTHEEIPNSEQFATQHGLQHNELVNVIKSLHGFHYIDAHDIKRGTWVLTEEGQKYAAQRSPEVQLFLAIPPDGTIPKDELQPSGFLQFLIHSQFRVFEYWDLYLTEMFLKFFVQHVEDKIKDLLIRVQSGQGIGKGGINSLKARKLIVAQTWKGYSVRKGPNYAPKRKKVATDLTRDNLQSYVELEFKEYNFNAKGLPAESGHLHPLLKHSPAAPSTTGDLPEDYVELVKGVHESDAFLVPIIFLPYSITTRLTNFLMHISEDICMTGKERKLTKTCCILIQLPSPLECFMLLQRFDFLSALHLSS